MWRKLKQTINQEHLVEIPKIELDSVNKHCILLDSFFRLREGKTESWTYMYKGTVTRRR